MLTKNQIQLIRDLHRKKGRAEQGAFICEGEKIVEELLLSSWEIIGIYALEEWINAHPDKQIPVTAVTQKELERISALSAPNQVLAIVRVRQEKFSSEKAQNGLTLLLDQIKDPGNLGTIIRTAEWFGVQQIVCSPESVDLYNAKTIQSAMGSVFRISVVEAELTGIIESLQKSAIPVYTAEMSGESVFSSFFSHACAVLMGSESHGVDPVLSKLVNHKISIPRFGMAESLNVAVATAVICAEYARMRGKILE